MSLIQEQSPKIAASVIKDFGKFGFLYSVRMACAEPNNRLAIFSPERMVVCHTTCFIEMLSGLFVNFSMRLLIFSSHRRIISIEK